MGAAVLVPLAIAALSTAATVIPAVTAKQPKPFVPPSGPDQAQLNKDLVASEEKTRNQARATTGTNSTILTSPLGSSDNPNKPTTLLGQ